MYGMDKKKKKKMIGCGYMSRKEMMYGGSSKRMKKAHGGGIHYYDSIEDKERKCNAMVGMNTMKSSTDK